MKVMIVGFSKTGTKSMNSAMRMLGYTVYDYEHNFYYLRKEWTKILTKGGTKEDFYNMYKDVDVTLDIPVVVFWEEMLEAFPDCKLIFMHRKTEEEWLRSWEKTAKSVDDNYLLKSLAWFSPTGRSIFQYSHHVGRVVFGSSSTRFYQAYQGISPTVAKKRYRDHNTSVMARAPKDQLLDFHMSEGWEPLCKFLGRPIPDHPFPHKNKGSTLVDDWLKQSPIFLGMKQEMKIMAALLVALVAVGVAYFLFV